MPVWCPALEERVHLDVTGHESVTTFSSKMPKEHEVISGSTPAASTKIHDGCDGDSSVVPTGCPFVATAPMS